MCKAISCGQAAAPLRVVQRTEALTAGLIPLVVTSLLQAPHPVRCQPAQLINTHIDPCFCTQADNYDVNNEMLHGDFFTSRMPCDPNVRAALGPVASPCICDYAPACPPEMGVPADIDIHTWMYRAVSAFHTV